MIRFLYYLAKAVIIVHLNRHLSLDRQLRKTEKRLVREIRRAYRDVPFYRKLYDEWGVDIDEIRTLDDVRQLPCITKDDIREQFPNNIVSGKYDVEKCHYSATTGSTGRSLPFVFSLPTFAFYIATGVRMYTMIGYRPWHKVVYIKYTKIDYPRLGPFFRTEHIPSTIPVEEQVASLRTMKPDLLIGYASIVLEIAQRMTPDDLALIRPRFIGINSELSTADQREFIAKTFNCPVYDEYSTEETWMVASQCREGNYHLFIDNVWVEFLDANGYPVRPGEEGEMVITTTRSPAMPFIRYRIGDRGRPAAQTCSCGMGFPLLGSFEGRADDSFILPSGRYVSSLKILNTFTRFIKKYLHLMEEFKITQKDHGFIHIELVRGREYSDARLKELTDSLHALLGEPVSINVEFTSAIRHTGIKRKAIESWVTGRQDSAQPSAG